MNEIVEDTDKMEICMCRERGEWLEESKENQGKEREAKEKKTTT